MGTFASFREAMIQALGSTIVDAGGNESRPLTGLTARTPDDFGIALIEMWAYIADILTFYQERIANEVYFDCLAL